MSVISTSVSEYSPGSDDNVCNELNQEYPSLRERYVLRSTNNKKRIYQQDHYDTNDCSNPKRYKQSVNATTTHSSVPKSTPVISDDDDDDDWMKMTSRSEPHPSFRSQACLCLLQNYTKTRVVRRK